MFGDWAGGCEGNGGLAAAATYKITKHRIDIITMTGNESAWRGMANKYKWLNAVGGAVHILRPLCIYILQFAK